MRELILSEIWIYPIKSLGGIQTTQARVFEKGLEMDRRWMLIDNQGVFLTQRVHSKMALFKVDVADSNLVVTFRGKHSLPSITIPIGSNEQGLTLSAKIWNDNVDVMEVDPVISQWFSQHMNFDCRLVQFPEGNPRPVDPAYSVDDEDVSLADAYPFLIIGQSSLDDLNRRLRDAVPMNRFRPNFVFTGGQPYEEDEWRDFTMGSNRFRGVKPCSRCVLTTVNQDTGEKGTEPLATLSTYRKKGNKVLFGQNVVGFDKNILRVGDRITVTSRDSITI